MVTHLQIGHVVKHTGFKEVINMKAKLLSQSFVMTDEKGQFTCPVKIDEKHIELGKEFVFRSTNSKETIKRWKKVIQMLSFTVRFLEKKVNERKNVC